MNIILYNMPNILFIYFFNLLLCKRLSILILCSLFPLHFLYLPNNIIIYYNFNIFSFTFSAIKRFYNFFTVCSVYDVSLLCNRIQYSEIKCNYLLQLLCILYHYSFVVVKNYFFQTKSDFYVIIIS
jgi:hypothetical protein